MAMALLGYTLAIWAIGLLGVLAPLVMATYNRMALALCNSAAAGVMLGAGFHLLHDASMSLLGLSDRWNSFPVAEFTCGLAFLLVFYIETLFAPPVAAGEHHLLVDHMQVDRLAECFPPRGWEWQDQECGGGEGNPPVGGHGHGHGHDEHGHGHEEHEHDHHHDHHHHPGGYSATGPGNGVRHGLLAHMHHTRVHHPHSPDRKRSGSGSGSGALDRPAPAPAPQPPPSSSLYQSLGGSKAAAGAGRASPSPNPPPSKSTASSSHPSPTQALLSHRQGHGHGHDHDHDHGHDHEHSLAGALCLLAALGFHSVIEGLGLATASYHDGDHGGRDSTQLGVFLAILAHKGLTGITLGSTMLLASVNQTQFLLTALVFSAATPFGVGIGVVISSYYHSSVVLGLMAAVAAGTFIHVAAIEIIPSAFKDSSATHLAKLLSLTVGFLAMTALSLVTATSKHGG